MRGFLPACLLALLAACASRSQTDKSDWEMQHQGELVREAADAAPAPELPPYPRRENLTEFFVSSASDFRFFIDRSSIGVKDRVVRYVLVARSPSGVDNVSFEAINCAAGEYRIYARGRSDGAWTSRPGGWQKIVPRSVQRWHNALYAEFFCPAGVAIADAAEGARALERGANPLSAAPNSKGAVGNSPAF